MKPEEVCETCKSYMTTTAQPMETGECHCNPPGVLAMITPNGQQTVGGVFPPTKQTSWCLKWTQGTLVKPTTKMPRNILPMTEGPGIN